LIGGALLPPATAGAATTVGEVSSRHRDKLPMHIEVQSGDLHKRIIRLGSGVLGVKPGGTGKVKIKITKLGRKLLARRGSIAAVAVINSHDSLSPNKKLTFNVKLTGKRAKRHRHPH
jgi:hypothetical protein